MPDIDISKLELRFEAPAGQRFHRYGFGIVATPRSGGEDMWWSPDCRSWLTDTQCRERGARFSSHCVPVRTLKAFRRHLRRHVDELAGCEVTWVSRYEGHNVSTSIPSQETF